MPSNITKQMIATTCLAFSISAYAHTYQFVIDNPSSNTVHIHDLNPLWGRTDTDLLTQGKIANAIKTSNEKNMLQQQQPHTMEQHHFNKDNLR